jgi:hypothetical protein
MHFVKKYTWYDNFIPPATKLGGYTGFSLSVCLSVRPSSGFSVFRTYFGLNMQIMKWNLVWLFTMISYRSSLSFVVFDQYLPELSPLDLEFSWKFPFSGHILDYFFGYWNETLYDCLQWWATDQVWVSLLLINICLSYGLSWKFEFSQHILDYFFGYWNETWYDCLQ